MPYTETRITLTNLYNQMDIFWIFIGAYIKLFVTQLCIYFTQKVFNEAVNNDVNFYGEIKFAQH